MKTSMKLWLAALSLMSFGVVSEAQESIEYERAQQTRQPAVRMLTSEQQAALDKQDRDIDQAAMNIVRLIDQGKAADVWETASPVAKKIISRDDFATKIAHDRSALGTPGMRMPLGVRHLRYDGSGNMPAGAFINVSFDTQFGDTPRSMHEMVTFILDADNTWRFVGYAVR
jgi:hypothetical protein